MGRRAFAPQGACASAELAAWVQLFDGQFDYVFRTLRNLGASPSDIDDLAQEVFLAMWRRRGVYDPERPLRPWIAGIAFRALQEHRRRGRREVPVGLAPELPDEVPCADERLEAEHVRRLMLAALARVPEKQRVVLVMHELDGHSMREIAEALSVPLFTLYSRLKRGLSAFAKEVRRREVLSSLAPALRSVAPSALLARGADTARVPRGARERTMRRLSVLLLGPELGSDLGRSSSGGRSRRHTRPAQPPRPLLAVALGAAVVVGVFSSVLFVSGRSGAGEVIGREGGAAPIGGATPPGGQATPTAHHHRSTRWTPPEAQADVVPAALARGLVGYWSFDEAHGSGAARDISGQRNDCVLRNLDREAVWAEGALAGALTLTGKGWLECPVTGALAGLEQELTIAAWVTRGHVLRNYHSLVARQRDWGREDEFMFGFANGELFFASHAWRGKVVHPLPTGLGHWFHVAVTRRDDGTTTLFVDGVEIARGQTKPAVLPRGSNPLIIGAAVNGSDPTRTEARFDGAVDELIIYDRALAPREIEALAARRQPPTSP